MGKRKYIYLAVLLLGVIKYMSIYSGGNNYDYQCPLPAIAKVALIVYGDDVSDADLTEVKSLVESVYNVQAEVLRKEHAELDSVYDSVRGQYNVDRLLDLWEPTLPAEYARGLIVLDQGIYGEGTNYVFGTGDNPGKMAAITVKGYGLRLGRVRVEHAIFSKILRSLVLHEIGHTLGLEHCENRCAMKFGNNIIDELKKYDRYCSSCEKRAQAPVGL